MRKKITNTPSILRLFSHFSITSVLSSARALMRTDGAFLVILLIAVTLRIWDLPNKGVFFGDAGRDFLAAQQMVDERHIPLTGIATSVPVFHQGPAMIWMIGAVGVASGWDPTALFASFALFGILAVVLLYWLLEKELNNRMFSLTTTALLASAPLAVAHSRMAYHVTPIPLLTVLYLITIVMVLRKHKHAILLSALTWGVLFQFELSLLPLLLVLVVAGWSTRQFSIKHIRNLALGGLIGTLPFLAQFPTLFGKLRDKLTSNEGEELLNRMIVHFPETLENFWGYGQKFLSVENPGQTAVMLALLGLGGVFVISQWKTLPLLIKATAVSFFFLTLGYVIRSRPSEAYMPPYFIYAPILIGWGVAQIRAVQPVIGKSLQLLILIGCIINTHAIIATNFFVLPTSSSHHYGVSYGEQANIVRFLHATYPQSPLIFDSTAPDNQFASYLDTYRFIHTTDPQSRSSSNNHSDRLTQPMRVFIETPSSTLLNYPGALVYRFPSANVVILPPPISPFAQ